MAAVAVHAESVGLDVFATGEHHNPPFVSSSPTTLLAYIAAAGTAPRAEDLSASAESGAPPTLHADVLAGHPG